MNSPASLLQPLSRLFLHLQTQITIKSAEKRKLEGEITHKLPFHDHLCEYENIVYVF